MSSFSDTMVSYLFLLLSKLFYYFYSISLDLVPSVCIRSYMATAGQLQAGEFGWDQFVWQWQAGCKLVNSVASW